MARSYVDEIAVPKDGKWPSVLTFVVGLSYGIVGVVQIIVSVGLIAPIMGFNDIVEGFLLIIVSSVFLTGVRPLSKNEQEGYAFIAVGYILAAILFALQILVIITNSLGWFLGFETWLSWNIFNDITPSLWMFIVLMTSTGALWILGNMRERLEIKTTKEALQ